MGADGADQRDGVEIQLRAFADFVAMLGRTAPGSRLVELEGGVRGAVVPAAPRRSLPNSVTYRETPALLGGLDTLAAAYDDAMVRAWTVWTPEFDHEAIAGLERAGHVLDGHPNAMVLDLAELGPVDLGDLDWDADADLALLGSLNDNAYGLDATNGLSPGFRQLPEGIDLRLYRARVNGEPGCVLGTIDHAPAPGAAGPDCGIYFVATAPRFRGRGLATRLMLAALAEARERGCATSSLQSSARGESIYQAIGYRPCFRFHLYERRSG